MDNKEYINFDEAVTLLKTTRSTLYKWLQAGQVPGHKLGRQWRFRKGELTSFLDGSSADQKLQEGMNKLSQLLDERASTKKEKSMSTQDIGALAEKLLWDAADANATDIHFQPTKNSYNLAYRQGGDFEPITSFDKDVFEAITSYWYQISSPTTTDTKRRFFLEKDEGDRKETLQVRTQHLDTVQGPRVTLRLVKDWRLQIPLKCAIPDSENYDTFQNWCSRPNGIIVIAGQSGSGKTTTLYSAIQELIKKNHVTFTLESPVEFIIEGANQVEVDYSDQRKVKEAYDAINDSDLDVLCLGLGSEEHSKDLMTELAYRSAASGHLVFLQMEARSAEKAMVELSKHPQIEDQLIGISWQKLKPRPSGTGRVAEHVLLSGKMAP